VPCGSEGLPPVSLKGEPGLEEPLFDSCFILFEDAKEQNLCEG
jgi:hypothetical protein